MENQTEKQAVKQSPAPPKSAYWWLAGIFAIVFAVIYIALLLRTFFLTDESKEMNNVATNLLFAFEIIVLLVALYIYTVVSRKELLYSLKEAGAIMTVFCIVVTANIYLAYINPYLMLVSLTGMIALPFSKKRDAFVLNLFACIMASFTLLDGFDKDNYQAIAFTVIAGLLSGAIAIYSFPSAMTRVFSVLRSFLTGVSLIAIYFVLMCAYDLGFDMFVGNILYIGIAAAGQLLLSGVIEPLIELIFNVATDYKLMELTNHNAPLVKRLSQEAPGTFNHCLAVANFAEICANAIGEDPILARACAYYHDMGKLNNPMYFTENQGGYNPHDEILPEVSAEIIRQHTVDGYELCKKYRIPEEVARITIEHHGTLPISYFYNKAKSLTDSEVDIEEYRYHGEIPTGKIGAIIMICDSAEAAIRAMDKPDGEKVDKLLRYMIDERLKLGQFDNCAITMQDLNTVRMAIVGAYGGLFHKRIKYNNGRGT